MDNKSESIRKLSPMEDLFKQTVDKADSKEESNPYRDKRVTRCLATETIERFNVKDIDIIMDEFYRKEGKE